MKISKGLLRKQWKTLGGYFILLHPRDLQSFEIRFEFESAVPIRFESDGPIRIRRTCPLLVVVNDSNH